MKNRKVFKLFLAFSFVTFGLVFVSIISPQKAEAAYTTVTIGGKYTVHDMVMYSTGTEITSYPGNLNGVNRQAKKVIERKWGSVNKKQKYKIVYDTYSYPKNLWSRGGGIENVRVYKA